MDSGRRTIEQCLYCRTNLFIQEVAEQPWAVPVVFNDHVAGCHQEAYGDKTANLSSDW